MLLGLLLAAESPVEKAEPLTTDDFIKAELAKLQGEWELESLLADGKKGSATDLKIRRKIEGDNFVLTKRGDENNTLKGKYRLDPTKGLKHIDVIRLDEKGKEELSLGIYELHGDTQRACMSRPGDERPDDFSSKEGSGRTLLVWKRVK